ncbi:MAG: hypothetical protein LBK44_04625 [Spirochaetales bacterium]|jgi:hypothetical protein|nr:hypothetical protein [Spirochaetales bacterium]
MIPVAKQPEPEVFNEKVRMPGQLFLKNNPSPKSIQFRHHNYWRHIKENLYQQYKNICAYTGEWFPEPSSSVDHFIPKSIEPQLAYEWDNYRLTTDIMNSIKGDKTDIADPFEVQFGWFVIILPGCSITPCKNLNELDRKKIDNTITALQLNSYGRITSRYNIISAYINEDITFDFLKEKYPYIAYELERQGSREEVADLFKPWDQINNDL